jgi:uncharacterized protein (DUF305 family)
MTQTFPGVSSTLRMLALLVLTAGCGAGGHGGGEHDAGHAPAPAATSEDHADHADTGAAGAADHAAHGAHGDHGLHDLGATAGPGYTVTDVRFMQMMIGHHAQALTMAEMAPTHGAGDAIRTLAHRIDISQRDEIELMQQWLRDRGQPVPDEEQMHTMEMPGMVTPAQFAQLGAARGPEFDRLFLVFMIEHHVGALEMVDDLFANPLAGQDSDIFRFATDVAADQFDEIAVMERILAGLDPSSRSNSR